MIKKITLMLITIFVYTSSWLPSESNATNPIKKISLKNENGSDYLNIEFQESVKFTPRILVLPKGVKILLTFSQNVISPKTKRLSHPVLSGYFFEHVSPQSIMFIASFNENVSFLQKKYTNHAIKLEFKIQKKKTIIVDAGHGGKDFGAKGVYGDYEKNIALATAIELRNLLLKSKKYNVVLTRDKDSHLSIKERIAIASSANGDLFISIHTDSNPDANFRGMSVYTLPSLCKVRNYEYNSKKDIEQYYDLLIKSRSFAQHLIKYFPDICTAHSRPCRDTELKILKLKIPAIIIELGCISNKIDNELLHSLDFRDKAVHAVMYAIDDYFAEGNK